MTRALTFKDSGRRLSPGSTQPSSELRPEEAGRPICRPFSILIVPAWSTKRSRTCRQHWLPQKYTCRTLQSSHFRHVLPNHFTVIVAQYCWNRGWTLPLSGRQKNTLQDRPPRNTFFFQNFISLSLRLLWVGWAVKNRSRNCRGSCYFGALSQAMRWGREDLTGTLRIFPQALEESAWALPLPNLQREEALKPTTSHGWADQDRRWMGLPKKEMVVHPHRCKSPFSFLACLKQNLEKEQVVL